MSERLERAFEAVDAENARDPRHEVIDGQPVPFELAYGRRMSAWLERLDPAAGELVALAVRAQHVGRFAVPRADYPDGVVGYKRWRADLGRRHGETAERIARAAGYDAGEAARVRDLTQKKGFKADAGAQTVEDVACLVFLEHYFAEFAGKHDRAKLVDIVRKTWRKMSPRGHAAALGLALGPAEASIIEEALAAPATDGESP